MGAVQRSQWTADEATDDAAAKAFLAEYADRAEHLPPVAIVIAAYNEQGVIGSVVDALPAAICGLGTAAVVVSDGSRDETVAEGREHGALVADVPVNRGQGAALRLGYRLAREGGAQYIVTTDADGQYNPAEMERVLAPVVAGDADFVTGSRKLGSQETKDPVRRLGTWVFATTISRADRHAHHRLVVRPAGDAGRGHRGGPAGAAAVPVGRTADRRAGPRLPGDRGPGHDPQAAGRGEQEGAQRHLRPALRRGGHRHLVARAAPPRPGDGHPGAATAAEQARWTPTQPSGTRPDPGCRNRSRDRPWCPHRPGQRRWPGW